MTANIGMIDRVVRFVLGVALILAPFVTDIALFASPAGAWISVIVGAVLVGTSAMKFCPMYRLLGMNTCNR